MGDKNSLYLLPPPRTATGLNGDLLTNVLLCSERTAAASSTIKTAL